MLEGVGQEGERERGREEGREGGRESKREERRKGRNNENCLLHIYTPIAMTKSIHNSCFTMHASDKNLSSTLSVCSD